MSFTFLQAYGKEGTKEATKEGRKEGRKEKSSISQV